MKFILVCFVGALAVVSTFGKNPHTTTRANILQSCDNNMCSHACLYYYGEQGSCTDGKCRCSTPQPNAMAAMFTEDSDSSEGADTCDNMCSNICLYIYGDEGSCTDGKCRCTSHPNAMVDMDTEDTDESEGADILQSCDNNECSNTCLYNYGKQGSCTDGQCRCTSHLYAMADMDTEDTDESEGADILQSCDNNECSNICHYIYGEQGSCTDGQCQCSTPQPNAMADIDTEDSDSSEEISIEGGCTISSCILECIKKGKVGVCVFGKCKCI